MDRSHIVIHPKDNVAVALRSLNAGDVVCVDGQTIEVKSHIPMRHKFAVRPIAKGEAVVKYGWPIGRARRDLGPGEWVHVEEVETGLSGLTDYVYDPRPARKEASIPALTFMGYERENRAVGIRNEIWIVNTVGCVNDTARILGKQASEQFRGRVDGIYAFPHLYGCSQLGQDLVSTQKILAGMVAHPNAGGVLVLSLGCENNHVNAFKKIIGEFDPQRVKFLVAQQVEDEIDEGMRLIEEMVERAQAPTRRAVPISRLKIGLKCGASDGFSGISANPLVGAVSDRVIACGGTAVLTEVSETFGAESILMNRCASPAIFHDAVRMINDFKNYYIRYGQQIHENPSPGNRRGGISTLEEKSLGCIEKGGTSDVTDVLAYGERVRTPGLNLLSSPGDDMIAITALMAAGCQMILFTTGNGNPLGAAVPTVKISSNTALFEKKRHWIDFDAGPLLEGKDMGELAGQLMELVLQVASGYVQARNEMQGYRGISMLKDGATL